MKSQQRLESTTVSTLSNRQLWLTFSMEETMKQLQANQPTKKETAMKKVVLMLSVIFTLLLSACSQQPSPEQTLESQGLNTWSFPQETVASGLSAYPNSAVLAVTTNSSNNPIVAHKNTNYGLSVKRWFNNNWQAMGGQVNAASTEVSGFGGAAIVKNGNTPIIAYSEQTATTYKMYVKRWNGSSWTSYGSGTALNINVAEYAYQPALAVDDSGYPIVAWTENVDSTTTKVYVKRWNGSSWDTLGSSGLLHGSSPRVAIGSNGKPVLAYLKCVSGNDSNCTNKDLYVVRRETVEIKPGLFSVIWNTLGQTLESSASVSPGNLTLAIHNNEPVVAWLENGYIYVKRLGQLCQLNGSCSPIWLNLSPVAPSANFEAAGFSMAVNSSGEPVIAYTTCLSGDLCVDYSLKVMIRSSSSNTWQSSVTLDSVLTNEVRKPVLSVSGKTYTVAWLEFGSDALNSDIKLKQYSTFVVVQPF